MRHPWSLLALLLHMTTSSADPIHASAQGAFQHHESGWIFPQQLVGFTRVGAPQDVDGSRAAVAYYARSEQGVRSTAVIDVYPKDSAAGALTSRQAEAAIEGERSLATAKKLRTQLEVRKQPALVATRTLYRTSGGTTALYFIATTEWIVKIRIDAAQLSAVVLDDFVCQQRWDSLGNTLSD